MAHAGDLIESKIDAGSPAQAARRAASAEHNEAPVTLPGDGDSAAASSASLLSSGELARLVVRGGTWSLLISALGAALSLGVHLVLARILGAEEYGQYVFALAWMNVLVLRREV